MQNKIDDILADLYESDPTLRRHDSALRKLAVELLELRPGAQMDETFRQDLRRRLMAMAEAKSAQPSLINSFMKNFQFVGAGVAVFALVIAGAWYLNGVKDGSQDLTSMLVTPKFSKSADNAFGSLAALDANGARSQGGGGHGNVATQTPMAYGGESASGSPVETDMKMIAPNPVNFNYVYKGEELALVQDKVDVLKRIKNEQASGLSSFINGISMGLIDLNSFSNTQLQSFTFVEDRDLGYSVTVQMNEGSIYVNENWEKWQSLTCPSMMSSERFIGCPEPRRLKPEDVPADQAVIDVANQFLASHGIPRENYGEPKVNDQWRVQYELAADKSQIWIPDMVSVVYPLMLNGQVVHDEQGNPSGMNVAVRISPELAVSSVYDLTTQNYQSSSYDAETDVSRVMGLVAKGGFRNYNYTEKGAKTVDIELGTPEVSLVRLWNYKNGLNEELLVPSLIFPVIKAPTAEEVGPYGWYRTSVVIPLVKELLDNENGDGGIRPMIMEDDPAADPAVLRTDPDSPVSAM